MIKRVIKSNYNNINKPKTNRPEKFQAVLKLPYIGETIREFENRVKYLTKTIYNRVNSTITSVSNPVLKEQLKDLIPNKKKAL